METDNYAPLSERPNFSHALIFRSGYSANPMVAGDCELAVQQHRDGFTVWAWDDDWGAQAIFSLPAESTWRMLVEAMLERDDIATAASLARLTIIGECSPVAQLIALLWTDDGEHRSTVEWLLELPDVAIEQLAALRRGLLAPALRRMVRQLNDEADALGVMLGDFPLVVPLPLKSLSALEKAARQAFTVAAERERATQMLAEQALSPFQAAIAVIVQRWAADKPRRRYPGSGYLPPVGQAQLQRYLQQYVTTHQCLPHGVHTIPAGADLFNHSGRSFEVDFDRLGAR